MKINRKLSALIIFAAFGSNVFAGEYSLSGYVETGERLAIEDYEEELVADNYTYQNFNSKFEQKISPTLSCLVNMFSYNKNYDTKDVYDNTSNIYKIKLSNEWKNDTKQKYALNFWVDYKDKRYDNAAVNSYNQLKIKSSIERKVKDDYKLKLTAGINSFDFIESDQKDLFNVLGKVEGSKYILTDIVLGSTYKVESSNKKLTGKDKIKQEVSSFIDYNVKSKLIYKLSTELKYGQRDSRDDEDIDADYETDYTYFNYMFKTCHRLNDTLNTSLKYEYYKKNHLADVYDYNRNSFSTYWKYEIMRDKVSSIWLNIFGEYKKIDYENALDNNYNNKNIKLRLNYKINEKYKTYMILEDSFYDYTNAVKNKDILNFDLGFEKYFMNNNCILSLAYKRTFISYKYGNDIANNGIRFSFKFTF
ncbi:MAG: hypothetical protein ABH857_05650 [Elusimicrobiota bacterium]